MMVPLAMETGAMSTFLTPMRGAVTISTEKVRNPDYKAGDPFESRWVDVMVIKV